MADMFREREVVSYIADWKAHYGDTELGRKRYQKHMKRVAEEQRANYESCIYGGRRPHWCDPDEYRRCVERLEREAHAESAEKIGNEEEAQAFAAMLQKLLLKHKLSMTEVEVAAEDLS